MKKNTNRKKRFFIRYITFIIMLTCLLGTFSPFSAYATEDEEQKIRVGFFFRDGYHMIDESGNKSGYGYEVLQHMARYSNFSYEYIGYDKSRAEAFEMLENGEIDIITSAHESSKRLEEYSFSEINIGFCSTMMTVKAGNLNIQAGNYETYNGIRVGLVKDDIHDVCFHEYSVEKGFDYTPVYYNTVEDTVQALLAGEVDAAATGSVRVLNEDEWYLDAFHEEPMYVVVKKGNEELLEQVNEALEILDLNEPDWRLKLLEKYYPKDKGTMLNLSLSEMEYLAEQAENETVFQVLVNPNRYPYSYIEDGKYKGIMVDLFANLANKAGIEYEYIMVENRKEYVDMLNSTEPDICIDCSDDFSTAENQGFRITDVYLKINYSWLYRSDHVGVITKGARLAYTSVKDSDRNSFGNIEYVDYLYDEDAIEAVRRGDVEGYSTNSLHAEKIIWEDEKNELQASVTGNTLDFTIGVATHEDNRLLSILNKSVNNMDEDLLDEIKAEYTYLGEREFSWTRLFSEYPWIAMLIVLFIVVITLFLIYFKLQKRYQQQILREIKAAEKANQAKSEFISRMSHDIRTPINGIVGMIEVARRNLDDKAKVKECLVKMFVASKQLGNLVNDVLNVSQLDAELENYKEEPFNLEDQLEYCRDVISGKMYERNLTFEHDFTKIKHPYLIGSDVHLNEVIINILGNCVKYTKDGGYVRFFVEETEVKDNKKAVFCFRMEDTGIGMSKEFLQKIYEPFTQETTSSRTTYEGTGLGMTIVKSLVEKMGGKLEIESEVGVGSKFMLYLEFEIDKTMEIETAETPEILEMQSGEDETLDDLTGLQVMVVDDIDLNIEIIQSILEDEGAIVIPAYDGKEAVDIFTASEIGSIPLILMDIRMPVMDGIEATETIRSLDRSDAKEVVILAISANSFETDAEKSKAAGMNGHMNKPVDIGELISTVAGYKKFRRI